MSEKSPVAEAAAWARHEIMKRVEEVGEVQLPDVTKAMVEHFGKDPAWVQRFLSETFRPVCYDVAQRQVARTRRHILFGEMVVEREEVRRKRSPKWVGFLDRLEYVGDRHIPIGLMHREELLKAAALRRNRGSREYEVAALMEALAEKLSRPSLMVADVWSNEEVANLIASMKISVEVQVDLEEPPAFAAD